MREKTRTEFGKRLFESRKEAGLTQAQLAKACGLGQSTIAELESIGAGSSATPLMANAIHVNADWLASGKGEKVSSAVWPFPGIDRQRFDDLQPNQQIEIQGVVRDKINEFERMNASPAKSAPGKQSITDQLLAKERRYIEERRRINAERRRGAL